MLKEPVCPSCGADLTCDAALRVRTRDSFAKMVPNDILGTELFPAPAYRFEYTARMFPDIVMSCNACGYVVRDDENGGWK